MFDVVYLSYFQENKCRYDFDFVLGYPKFARKYALEKINAQAKTLFHSDPCTISTIIPKKIMTEHHD